MEKAALNIKVRSNKTNIIINFKQIVSFHDYKCNIRSCIVICNCSCCLVCKLKIVTRGTTVLKCNVFVCYIDA